MNIVSVAQAFRTGVNIDRAVDVLLHFNRPLTEREHITLQEFTQEYHQKVAGGATDKELQIPDTIQQLLKKPTAAIPSSQVVMCVVVASKRPSISPRVQRQLQKVVLPNTVKKAPLSAAEWGTVLSTAEKALCSTPASLRCTEEVLRYSYAAVVTAAAGDSGAAAASTAHLSVWATLLSEVIRRYAAAHAASRKHSARNSFLDVPPRAHESFLSSVRSCRIQRFLASQPEALAALKSHVASLGGNAAATRTTVPISLFIHALDQSPIPGGLLSCALKSYPGLISILLGRTGAIATGGTVAVKDFDDLVLFCLYNLGLTSSTEQFAEDCLVVLQSLPPAELAAYVQAKMDDVIAQILNPFVNNPKVFHPKFAPTVVNALGRIYARADLAATLVPLLCKQAAHTMTARCRSGDEKACVLMLVDRVCKAALCAPTSTPSQSLISNADLNALVRSELESSSEAACDAAWSLLRTLGAFSQVSALVSAAVKNAICSEPLRRTILTYAPPTQPEIAVLAKPLMEESGEVELYRPDALLSLAFAVHSAPSLIASTWRNVARRDVIDSFTSERDLVQIAEVAVSLASAGHYDALALLLTHPSGRVRSRLSAYVDSISGNPSAVISLWDAVVRSVFGFDAPEAPQILSGGAAHVLQVVSSALLRHTAKLVVRSALLEVLLCCGHDNVVGHDPLFFTCDEQCIGRYRSSSAKFDSRSFDSIFSSHRHLLILHNESISQALVQKLSGPAHTCAAAIRATALLLRVAPPTITVSVFRLLKDTIAASVKYFVGLPPLDAAIASSDSGELEAYQRSALTQRGVLKEYGAKPPKGMSEEDYEDMKRKDAVALKSAREALTKEIEKRAAQIAASARNHASPFALLRAVGASSLCKSWEGVCVIYSDLQQILSLDPIPGVLYRLALDAIVNLLSSSALRPVAQVMATTVGRLRGAKALLSSDTATIAAIAHLMRQENIVHLPPGLCCVLIPFCEVAFTSSSSKNAKVIPVAAQHQLLSILNANTGQEHVPELASILRLYFRILKNFPALYKSVLHGAQGVMERILPADTTPLYDALLDSVDVVKECAANTFTKYRCFEEDRRSLVVAAVMQHDDSVSVNQCMTVILKRFQFELRELDWDDVIFMLDAYGKNGASCARIAKVVHCLIVALPATQAYAIPKIIAVGGIAAAKTLGSLASASLQSSSTLLAMEFLMSVAENATSTEALMEAVLSAGKELLQQCSLDSLKQIAPPLQVRLKQPPTTSTAEHKELYLSIAVVWLTVIGCRVNDTSFLEGVIAQQATVLNASTSANVHYFVCDCMAEIASNKVIAESTKLSEFAENCLKVALTSGSYAKKKAHACGLAGVVQGLGLRSLRRFKVVESIVAAAKEKQAQRSGAMILIEVLSEVLGSSFEPYALVLTPWLLEGVAEKDPKISECADDAAKAMMRSLSDVGLRQLIPRLVQGLLSDQTKKRTPSLGFIGYVAFCSPKQLAATLPSIMKHICECLFDANSSVSNAAFTALKRVAGVVSNPEIQEHIDAILNAMRFPSTETEGALDALLYTRFVNVVDPASLALIVPVVQRGLGDQMNTKAKAAQITASMVNLVADKKSLLPYVDDLQIRLQNAAQDPSNEVRTTSAKAISALSAAMDESFANSVTEWVFSTLRRGTTSAEKAGAAQVLAEVIAACGESILVSNFDTLAAGMQDEAANVREGFLHFMIYAPATLPQSTFQDFLPSAFPWVLRGLSDFNERVRTVALTAGSGIIGLYGTRNLALVLSPLLDGVISETSNLRHSSMLLASKLLIHLVNQIKKKLRIETTAQEAPADQGEEGAAGAAEEPEDDISLAQAGEIRLETARDAEKRGVSILASLEELIGAEKFIRILAAMHIGRSEHNLNVRTDCSTAWQICVASPRAAMARIFGGVVTMLVKFASSDNAECVDVAQQSIEYTCARLTENVERFVDRLSEQYKEGSWRHKIGALTCLSAVVPFADSARLMKMGGQLISCVLPGMQDEDEVVRDRAGHLFEIVTKIVGSRLIESVVESQLSSSIRGVVEVVKVRPTVALAVIFKNLHGREQYTLHDLDLIANIIELEQAEEELPKFLDRICDILLVAIAQDLEGASDVMTTFASILPDHASTLPMPQFQRGMKHPSTKLATLRAAGAYGMGVHVDETECIEQILRIVITSLGDDDVDVRDLASKLLIDLMASLEKRAIADLGEEEQQDVATARRLAGRFMLQFLDVFQQTISVTVKSYITAETPEFPALANVKLFDALVTYYGKVLEWGSDPQRIQAVECIQDIFSSAPRAVAANAAAITAGRCTKILFARTAGSVVHALTQVCLQLMKYPTGGKERMVESNLALAMFNAVLCDSAPARTTALRIVDHLVRKTPVQGEVMLGHVATKRSITDTPPLKAVMCRFVSFVVRGAKIEKALSQIEKLVPVIRQFWESPEAAYVAAAAGSAIGALCASATVSDDDLDDISERALSFSKSRSSHALSGLAAIYGLLTAAPKRLPTSFATRAADAIKAVAPLSATDKLSSLWTMRCAARLWILNPSAAAPLPAELFVPHLRRIDEEDEIGNSTAKFLCDALQQHFPAFDQSSYFCAPSAQWLEHGSFDADLDDESVAEVFF